MTNDNEAFLEQLRELQALFLNELPGIQHELAIHLEAYRNQNNDDSLRAILKILHGLAGSSSTFGCDDLGFMSREAERDIIYKQNNHEAVDLIHCDAADFIDKVIHYRPAPKPELNIYTAFNQDEKHDQTKTLYMLEDNETYAQNMILQLSSYNYECQHFSDPEAFVEAVKEAKPDVLVVDIQIDQEEDKGLQVLNHIKQTLGIEIPAVIFTVRTDFEAMLQAERSGANAFLAKPVEADTLVYEIDRLLEQHDHSEHYKVLIIDDDSRLAKHHSLILAKAGIESHYISDPTLTEQALSDVNPDLILMDIYMPKCNGIELAHIIRFHPQYVHIPIVFLSTEGQISKQLAALRKGGDDFLTKPISNEHLCEAIRIRAARSRRLVDMMNKDSLSGLLKHGCMQERLSTELKRAKRTHANFSFVMIDIDHFKRVNDEYGHLTGDRVIKSLARLLQTRLRAIDIAARYGGEEFALILLNCSTSNAKNIVEELRETFAAQTFSTEQHNFQLTFSAGIAHSSNMDGPVAINQAADEALYLAKNSGRNQTKIFGED